MVRAYQKIGAVISHTTPADKEPILSEEQIGKLKTVGTIVLAIIAGAGIVTLIAIAPNVLGAMNKLLVRKHPNRVFKKREKDIKMTQAFYYLKRSGQIKMTCAGRDFKIVLTKLGKKRLRKLNIETMTITKPKFWNGYWWQVAADIPTKKHKRGADLFRQKLKDLQFYPLQRTLWFYPYDPRGEIEFIANYFNIGRFVTVMEINRLDREDEKRMQHFFKEEGII